MDALYYIDLAELTRLREIAAELKLTNPALSADLNRIAESAEKNVAWEF